MQVKQKMKVYNKIEILCISLIRDTSALFDLLSHF